MKGFRALTAQEIECRVGQISDDGFTLLLYKDARCDMNMLDEVVGSENWQREHKEVKGNLFCGVSIYDADKKEWVTKWDCGTESNTEKEKGEASDSFKRACVNWGIGRELYTAPVIRIKGNVKKTPKGKTIPAFWNITVASIGYNEKREIVELTIKGDNSVIFSYHNGKAVATTETTAQESPKIAPKTNAKPIAKQRQSKSDFCRKYGIVDYEKTIHIYEQRLGGNPYEEWTEEEIEVVEQDLARIKAKRDQERRMREAEGEFPFEVGV